ncbi:AraC family transcriptional regulator [Bordetella genomosp. 1]|uniref:AraC family transcriptional regulator n=1 Tax=Bordetella genomosp. 1 TaxID=1395607 RepID=A0A261RYD0_9BORD|nr:AraC family transcriptional regulator [Bordetella genomosp. 1]OZI29283.1 AraC family transcriptional regulator [Bordetella genomosp. 1]
MPVSPSLYDAPRLAHEWWRDTLPTVPVTPAWEDTIALVERVDQGVSLVVLKGRPDQELLLPSPGTALFGMQVWLEGGCELGFEGGPPARARGGELVLFEHTSPVGSAMRIPAHQPLHMIDIRYTPQALGVELRLPWRQWRQAAAMRDFSVPDRGGLLATCAAPQALLGHAAALLAPKVQTAQAASLWRRARVYDMLAQVTDLLAMPDRAAVADLGVLRQAERARQLLHADLAHPWTIAALARRVGVPEKRLQAAFRQETGQTVYDYLRASRLDAAALLLEAGVSVTDAALRVGFGNLSHFSKSFRERHGCVPTRWQRAPRSP